MSRQLFADGSEESDIWPVSTGHHLPQDRSLALVFGLEPPLFLELVAKVEASASNDERADKIFGNFVPKTVFFVVLAPMLMIL
jgi:hypothetical protein